MIWLNVVLQGVLIGGVYALSATGLALAFGVMRLINMAHGDVLVVAAYGAALALQAFGLGPLAALPLVVPVVALAGYGLQRFVLTRTLGADPLPSLLVTFGLSIVLQNLMQIAFSGDSRRLDAGWIETASLTLAPGLQIGVLPLIMFLVAVISLFGLQWVFGHTGLGRSFRAVAGDPEIARLMGIDTRHVYALAIALAFAFTALAGVFLAIRTNFDPGMGPSRLIVAFEVVVIGGLGRISGALVGGIVLGVAQAVGGAIDPQLQLMFGHIAFLATLLVKPNGLMAAKAG